MPLFALKREHEKIKRVEDPGNPETWPNALYEENTRLLADRYWYAEQVTADNPETTEDGTPIAEGNYCMWYRWSDGSYRRTESEREYFEKTYFDVDELPDQS
ncbi:hypothetical protein [Spirosoma rhododendri]|uniref:Uncharacterized protein n=1 Tax=Spirosoma rhododendri TaxID=2728024 RepID=A0A7L5DSL3_9BACT|nr:hypothetical protein [Spirosoma rhododendri]QJD79558.1 hypothetical protein HH216_14905 [Spirosoma rhododendri]